MCAQYVLSLSIPPRIAFILHYNLIGPKEGLSIWQLPALGLINRDPSESLVRKQRACLMSNRLPEVAELVTKLLLGAG
jgi:hypothetical protein